MNLDRQARQWYPQGLTATGPGGDPVDVPPTGWELSIDDGQTWVPSRDNSGRPGWLVAGPDFPGPGDTSNPLLTDAVITASVQPKIRLRDAPETIIEQAPWVWLAR